MPAVSNLKEIENSSINILKQFKNVTKNPEEFLRIQVKKAKQAKLLSKEVYGLSVRNDESGDYNGEIVLPELILDSMDEEQVWEQIELRNNLIVPRFVEKTSKLLAMKDTKFLISDSSEYNKSESIKDTDDEENMLNVNELENDEIMPIKIHKRKPIAHKTSIVDDKFFKLCEMEDFLKQEDKKEELKQKGKITVDEESIDYFNNLSDEDEENAKYQEFFDEEEEELSVESLRENRRKNLKKRRHSNESDRNVNSEEDDEFCYQKTRKSSKNSSLNFEGDFELEERDDNNENLEDDEDINQDDDQDQNDDDDDDDGEDNLENHSTGSAESVDEDAQTAYMPKSSFEQRQDRLRQRIEEYEENILQEKPWQLKGEITATRRPQNSLLEEILEFDAAVRPAPVITEETTLRLEDIIRQRIKDKAWDDVERKYKPIQTPQEFRKRLVLDQEKSKESLAQIYEKEYQSQLEKLDPSNSNEIEEEPKLHKEIRELMKTLFTKLDALSNFHYTPKPIAPEPKIITNTPAVNMEEVAPIAVSDANLLAPEEVKNHPKGDVIGKSERQKTDKKRERRKKKLHQKMVYKKCAERETEKQKLGLKLNKKDEKDRNLKNVIKHRNIQKIDVKPSEAISVKSSKAFFSTLQDRTVSNLKRESGKVQKDDRVSAKKLKL